MSNPRIPPSGTARLAPLGAITILLAACQTEVFGGKDTYSPGVEKKDYAQEKIDAGPRKIDVYGPGQMDPSTSSVGAIVDALLAFQPKPTSVACLPLVTYDLNTGKPWVSELGVGTADAVARALREKGFAGSAFATDEVGLRLAQTNVSRAAFTSMESVAANAERIGADVVVFGTIKRRDRAGALDRDVLTCELQAYDVAGKRIATSTRWEVPSDDTSYRRTWDLAQAESAWMPDSRYGVPGSAPSLASELQRVAGDLAVSLARTIDPAKVEGAYYVAPLDVAAFVPQLATLRSAQGAYVAEVSRRVDAAKSAGSQADFEGKIVLNGTEYPNFQAAEANLTQLSESFRATPAARFAQSFSSGLGDEIRARALPAGKAVNDLAAVAPADRAFVEGELAQGGVGRSVAARDALRAAGVGLVIAPRLERIGDVLQIRVDAYELAQGRIAGDGRVSIPAHLAAELERSLASASTAAIPNAPSKGQWSSLYGSVKSGVVHVVGSQGRGSGFVVRADGLILTNDHVARGIGEPITVTPEGGSPLPARIVASDAYWDLAAIQVVGLPKDCHVFTFADDVGVGTEVAVLGHPRDSSGWVLTPGYISSTSEQVSTDDGRARAALMYTSPTRQGSSGSPVLLADGRVAAVHSAGRVGQSLTDSSEKTELTGFALGIPAREARLFADKIARP